VAASGGGGTGEPAPIFVLGNARSGTTLMRLMLSAHPNIYISHETWFYHWEKLCPESMSGDEFLRHYFQTFSFRWKRIDPADVLSKLPTPLPRDRVSEALREILRLRAARNGKPRYGDKSPIHTAYVGRILTDFPDAKIIHTVRDPRATVLSQARMPWGSRSDVANCLAYEAVSRNMDLFKDYVLQVRLEDLLADPKTEMGRVLDYVGEPWDDAVLDHAAHLPVDDDMPPTPWLSQAAESVQRPEKPWARISSGRLRLIENMTKRSSDAYGYTREASGSPLARIGAFLTLLGSSGETRRYLKAIRRWVEADRDPAHWADLDGYLTLFKEVNPDYWKRNPGFDMPKPPPLPSSMPKQEQPAG